ncbi:MAG: YlmC/YmxH family sporulation protein [Clostridia bacterium]|nr:YlmC/YmxH family sporulation protein [Clostridia bacterium]
MELTYSQLKEREVINVTDGKSLGNVIDLTLSFPEGKLMGITVPGHKQGFFSRIFDRARLYIDRRDIKKIGGDVILFSLNCGDTCSDSVSLAKSTQEGCSKPCPPPCPPPCPSPCSPHCKPPNSNDNDGDNFPRIDLSDY